MLPKFSFLLKPTLWLFALLVITTALPARAQDEPYIFEKTEDETGYIMRPRPDMTYEQGVLDVPAVRESDGLPIVGVDGFSYQKGLLGIQFYPGSQVKYIGSFQGCTGIEFIDNMPATVETIADCAFQGCTRLRDLTLNKGLKYIGISCFEGCTSLESIKLPASLKVLRENAFRVCTALQTVEFEDGVDFYTGYSYGFYNNVFDGCESLHTVKLPKNTPGNFIIPMATFSWCSSLKSIECPANTYRIDQLAFYRTGIENLDLTTITSNEIFVEGYYTFAACESLKSVTANGNFRFSNTSLYPFQGCKALKTFTVNGSGDDYIKITPDAFRWCENLESVNVYRLKGTGENNEMDSVFVGCKSLKEVISTCEPEVNKVGYGCFLDCESLETVTLPKQGSFKVNESAFKGCAALQSLDLANVTLIGKEAFNGCNALTSITINNIPTLENEDAFDEWHFTNTRIAVPDEKYSTFTTDAFWSKFGNFKHPSLFAYNEVTGGYSVSKSQYALDEDFIGMLEIPGQYENGNVVAIAKDSFKGYTGLTGVTLPEGLTSIGENAFAGCTNIKTVINKATQPLTVDVCPENAFASETYTGNLTVPFGSLDAYSSSAPWTNFSDRIKQGFGERTLTAPLLSQESKEINKPLELTLTNNNEGGDIYYYIVSEDEAKDAVHTTYAYTNPITTPTKTCTVCAYISDGTNCSETASQKYTFVRLNTETGLDKVLAANAGDYYQINADLYGHYYDGTYLYASTVNNSGSAKNTYNEEKKSESLSDKESDFIQEDWVAISGLTSDYVGKQIGAGKLATVVSNTGYPVISFTEEVSTTDNSIDINTFRVENFNIHAESEIVRNMWLVAPQPGEYCKVLGFVNMENIHKDEGYLVLKSAESETINEYNTTIEPLTMNVYFDAATFNLGTVDGWYDYTGIVSKEGDALKFTALKSSSEPIYTGIEDVETDNLRIFAANGNINVAADDMTSIKVFSATGQLVSSLQASSATIPVAPGFYLVKVGDKTAKIVVK